MALSVLLRLLLYSIISLIFYTDNILAQNNPEISNSPKEELVNWANLTVVSFFEKGDYANALQLAEDTHALSETELGKEHDYTLTSMNNLGRIYTTVARYQDAESILMQALNIYKNKKNADLNNFLTTTNNLALVYHAWGKYDVAESLYLNIIEARKRRSEEGHRDTLLVSMNLAGLYRSKGLFIKAEKLYNDVLTSAEKTLGSADLITLACILNMGHISFSLGKYAKSEKFYIRAQRAYEDKFGAEHAETLSVAHSIAGLLHYQGYYGDAEKKYEEVIQARERVLGILHPDTVASIIGLASVYEAQRRLPEAEKLYDYSLKIAESNFPTDHPDTILIINNLGNLYLTQDRYDEAGILFERSLEKGKNILGKDHPNTITSLTNLAVVYLEKGLYDKAESIFKEALAFCDSHLGDEHPVTLTVLNNIARLYKDTKRYPTAEKYFHRTINASEKVYGNKHPRTHSAKMSRILMLVNEGELDEVSDRLRELDNDLRLFIDTQLLSTQREIVKRNLVDDMSIIQNVVYTLALTSENSGLKNLAADILLRWKHIAGEAESWITRIVHTSDDPLVIRTAKEVADARAALSHAVNLPNPKADRLIQLYNEVDNLELKLSKLSTDFSEFNRRRDITWQAIPKILPQHSALLELRLYRPIDFKNSTRGSWHWLAMIIPADSQKDKEPKFYDLGAFDTSMDIISEIRKNSSSKTLNARLYHQLFGKIDDQLKQYKSLYISSDGVLNLISLNSLVLPNDLFWIERQELHHIRSGRYLISTTKEAKGSGMLALGGINYKMFPNKKNRQEIDSSTNKKNKSKNVIASQFDRYPKDNIRKFSPLDYTLAEVDEIALYYWDKDDSKTTIWVDREAGESSLKQLDRAPRILHLATHGFFLGSRGSRTERPLTLSGLALAGANLGIEGKTDINGEDGILYALEAQALLLQGTDLVTLSACDTAKGEVDYSEGVYGMVRAFQIAGAQNVLMSLWHLNDKITKDFMADFYRELFNLSNFSPHDALRNTQLAWIRSADKKRRSPKYWAPFLLIERN